MIRATFPKIRRLSTLVATEEFPFTAKFSPIPSTPAVITESVSGNGIKVVSRDAGVSGNVSLKFSLIGGSRLESSSEKGVSHLISVSAFVGTQKRSGLKLIRSLENIGASVSSSSDREKITYDLTTPAEHLNEAVAAVAESILLPPPFKHLVNERKEIAQLAYDSLKTTPQLLLSELLHEAAYGEATPLGASLYANDVNDITYENVLKYRSNNFVSGNLVVTSSGISHDALKSVIECHFNTIPNKTSALPSSPYLGGDIRVKTSSGVTYTALAFETPVGTNAKAYTVLKAYLAAKLKSPTFIGSYSSGGLLGVYATGTAQEIAVQLQDAVAELKSVASGIITTNKLNAVKNQLTLSGTLALEGEATTATLLAASLSSQSAASYINVASVTAEDVTSAAKAVLASVPTYAVLGPTLGVPTWSVVEKLLK